MSFTTCCEALKFVICGISCSNILGMPFLQWNISHWEMETCGGLFSTACSAHDTRSGDCNSILDLIHLLIKQSSPLCNFCCLLLCMLGELQQVWSCKVCVTTGRRHRCLCNKESLFQDFIAVAESGELFPLSADNLTFPLILLPCVATT